LFLFASLFVFRAPIMAYKDPWTGRIFGEGGVVAGDHIQTNVQFDDVAGKVIMPKLGNATAKAELGRATWKLLHTMTLRYPEHPTEDERSALSSYFYLQSRLYPCGECAAEFQQLLKKWPPQTSSRKAAAGWLCFLHNQVNERLEKPEFDCSTLEALYDCGCGDEDEASKKTKEDPVVEENAGFEIIRGG